jgi:hypothetical protein
MARSFDAELAQLESLHATPPNETQAPLRKFLANKNNFIVSKAAKLALAHEHRTLTDALVAAFPRFATDGSKSDPQCWAKEAILRTLADFGYQEPNLFLIGMRTIQLEATWGGVTDTAGNLRGISALALVQCRDISNALVLTHVIPLLADKVLFVRVSAARAIEQVGTEAASLILRLRAELGSDSPELLGACYSGVVRLEGPSAIPWAARFLDSPYAATDADPNPDAAEAEAAFAIAETRTEAAFTLLHATWKQARDPDFRGTLLTAIALTRLDTAIDFLFEQIAEGSKAAREALENSAPSPAVLERLNNLRP